MKQISQFSFVPKPGATDIVYAAMQPAVRFRRDECVDLPPTTVSFRDVALTADQKKLYDKMMRELAVEVREKRITAANEGVKMFKLLQLCAGFIYDTNGVSNEFGAPNLYNEILDIVEQSEGKTLVFAPFRASVNSLSKFLNGKKIRTGVVHGDVVENIRADIFNQFQSGAEMQVIVAHPRTLSHGLTLTAASTIVWAVPYPSLETYEQANARITRPGQTRNTHIINVQSSPIEKRIYTRLLKKQKLQNTLLELFEGESE
jgi:SNF2 family DNA or RNA helicase